MSLVTRDVEELNDRLEQVRETFRGLVDFSIRELKPVEPPSYMHAEVLRREITELERTLQRIRIIVHGSLLSICASTAFFSAIIGFFLDMPPLGVLAAVMVAISGAASLWACITFHLRDL